MKAEELVGKWIVSGQLNGPVREALKVVGYNADMNCAIVDAYYWGWKGLYKGDFIAEKCKTYWYILLVNITKVL